jgi:hypothetical protein
MLDSDLSVLLDCDTLELFYSIIKSILFRVVNGVKSTCPAIFTLVDSNPTPCGDISRLLPLFCARKSVIFLITCALKNRL